MSDGQPSTHPAAPINRVPGHEQTDPPAFGRYRLTRKLGTGSYGEVWRGDDLFLNEPVALKFLNSGFAGSSLDDLKREVRTLRRLSHPNIVRVHDLVFDDLHTAIVMEFIDGATLGELLARSPKKCLQATDIEPWLPQLGSVFDYLHRSEAIIHSDIKPVNLMLTNTGRLKVADFGIASTLAGSTSHVTRAGAREGTIAYMSPQQMRGSRPAVADDIFALGATLFHLLAGSTPFHGSAMDLISPEKRAPTIGTRRHETGLGKLPPVPDHWESAIAACLAKDASLRPASVRDLVRWLKPENPGSSRYEIASVTLPPSAPPKSKPKSPSPTPAVPTPQANVSTPNAVSPARPSGGISDSTVIWIAVLVGGVLALVALLIVALRFL